MMRVVAVKCCVINGYAQSLRIGNTRVYSDCSFNVKE
jgi:hypothetical protein